MLAINIICEVDREENYTCRTVYAMMQTLVYGVSMRTSNDEMQWKGT